MGKRVNLGKVNHETVCRVWGLLSSELHEIVTSPDHIHLPSTLLLSCCSVLFTCHHDSRHRNKTFRHSHCWSR